MKEPVKFTVTNLLAALEYLMDRGEFDAAVVGVEPKVRYTDKTVASFTVKLKGGQKVRITGRVVPAPRKRRKL